MITDTLSANNTTLSSFAATLVGNKKIVVQKRASEIEKLSKRRESIDPRAEQQQQQQQQQIKLTSVKRLFPGVGATNSRSGSLLDEINSVVPGTDAPSSSGASRPRGKSSQSITAIKEDEEEDEEDD
jgi:hypothetical protein